MANNSSTAMKKEEKERVKKKFKTQTKKQAEKKQSAIVGILSLPKGEIIQYRYGTGMQLRTKIN